MSRLPIRLRLTLAFALVMALVLAGTGLLLYLRLGSSLDATIDAQLRARAADVGALVAQADTGLRDAGTRRVPEIAQVLDGRGRVFDATPALLARPLLSPAEAARARRATIRVERGRSPGLEGPVRLLAGPIRAQGRDLVVVVGASLGPRDQALSDLGRLLVVGGPIVLALASLGAFGLAAAALRPVESLRARAATISASELGRRLPVHRARDEIRGLAVTLNEMLDRVEASVERQRAFTAEASHELRTPLTMLRTELELMGREGPAEPARDAAIASALEEVDRLTRMVEDLLVLARADSDAPAVSPRPADVADIARGVAARFARTAPEAPVKVHAPRSLGAVVDPDRVAQALTNLLDNAARHGRGPVELRVAATGGEVELRVEDRGPGLPGGFASRAFERFARGPGTTVAGAGLGLAIVDAIARAHGGSAGIADRPGGGASAWVRLPRGGA